MVRMTSHDGRSRKATRTKSTKGTKREITQILQTHSGDHAGNRTRVATIRPARPSRLHRDAAASRPQCRRDWKWARLRSKRSFGCSDVPRFHVSSTQDNTSHAVELKP